jgi:hypothetical protein
MGDHIRRYNEVLMDLLRRPRETLPGVRELLAELRRVRSGRPRHVFVEELGRVAPRRHRPAGRLRRHRLAGDGGAPEARTRPLPACRRAGESRARPLYRAGGHRPRPRSRQGGGHAGRAGPLCQHRPAASAHRRPGPKQPEGLPYELV